MSLLYRAVECIGGRYLGFSPVLTREEARKILGVAISTGAQGINKNYRELLLRNHPDKGGSRYLAQKINEARELLRRT